MSSNTMNSRVAFISLAAIAVCVLAPASRADTSGPTGQWYLNANTFPISVNIVSPSPGTYTGTLVNESGVTETLDNITWHTNHLLEFRRIG